MLRAAERAARSAALCTLPLPGGGPADRRQGKRREDQDQPRAEQRRERLSAARPPGSDAQSPSETPRDAMPAASSETRPPGTRSGKRAPRGELPGGRVATRHGRPAGAPAPRPPAPPASARRERDEQAPAADRQVLRLERRHPEPTRDMDDRELGLRCGQTRPSRPRSARSSSTARWQRWPAGGCAPPAARRASSTAPSARGRRAGSGRGAGRPRRPRPAGSPRRSAPRPPPRRRPPGRGSARGRCRWPGSPGISRRLPRGIATMPPS